MSGARGLGFRGLPPVVAVLLLVGPVAASPPMGRLEVTVLDDVTGAPLVCNPLVQVVGGEYNVQVNTDFNGLAVFDPIPVGNYTVTVRPADPYFWARQTVSVGAKPPPTQITIRVERGEPTPYVEIMEPEGTVGNTVAVKYRFYLNDFHFLARVRIEAVPDGHAAPTQEISDLVGGQMGNSTPVGTATLPDGVTPVEIRERSVEWDTTGLYNAAYTLRVLVWYDDPWDPGGDDIDGTDEQGVAVRNLCFGEVTTSAGNPDYFLFDAKAGSGFEHPTITFAFKDEGQTSNAQGPYHYDWTAMVLTTQAEDPETACDAYVTGTTTSPGTVTVYLNDTAAQVAAGQQQIGELTAEHWGTLTFELCVEERETGDYYYYRMPYHLTIPETVPGTGLPGHNMHFASTEGVPCVLADYYLEDSEDASWFQVDVVSPELSVMGTANPGTQARHQYWHQVASAVTVFKPEPYITVFRAVDSHGDDGAARYHREREDKRMLAVNARQPPRIQSITFGTYGDNAPLDENPGNDVLGSRIGLRIFPDKKSSEDQGGDDRRKVTVSLQLAHELDLPRDGWPVVLRAFDVDDPSASLSPLDVELGWPDMGNADNRDQTWPKGQFEGGTDVKEGVTDENGRFTCVFLTGRQPGDNYRIVGGLGPIVSWPVMRARQNNPEEELPLCRVWQRVGPAGAPDEWQPVPETGPAKHLESGVLTVWQRVFYEYDRMWRHAIPLRNNASQGQQEFFTDAALPTGASVTVFDRSGRRQDGMHVVANQPVGEFTRVTLDAELDQDFPIVDRPFAAWYPDGGMEESLGVADVTSLAGAFAIAYVVFQAIPGQGLAPPKTDFSVQMEPEYYQTWFANSANTGNTVWLLGGDVDVDPRWNGLSSVEQNWAVLFWNRILEVHPAPEALVVSRESTVHEFGHQFGLLDWREFRGRDEAAHLVADGDVMIWDDDVDAPPVPQHPNIVTNGLVGFGPSNIGGLAPSIRGCVFPL